MKKVQYDGEDTRTFAYSGVTVSKGDVVEVEDDFNEFNFSDTKSPVRITVIVPPVEIPAPIIDAGATNQVASTDIPLVENDTERGV